MNLYLVLALALGAVSAAPVPQSQTTTVIAQRREQCVVSMEHRLQPVHASRLKPGLHRSPIAARRSLTGAASPRAPARG